MADGKAQSHAALEAELAQLRREFESLRQSLDGAAGEEAEKGGSRAGPGIGERLGRAGDWADESLDEAERALRARPVAGVAAAFGLGFVIGTMLRR